MRALKIIFVFLVGLSLVACSNDEPATSLEGKPPEYIVTSLDAPIDPVSSAEPVLTPANPSTSTMVEAKVDAEATLELFRETFRNAEGLYQTALEKFLKVFQGGGDQTSAVNILVAAIMEGIRAVAEDGTEIMRFGHVSWKFVEPVRDALHPPFDDSEMDSATVADVKGGGEEKIDKTIRQWMTSPGNLEAVWKLVSPILRRNRSLTMAIMEVEELFKKPYSALDPDFFELSICLGWHIEVARAPLGTGNSEKSEQDTLNKEVQCYTIFKKFHVALDYGNAKDPREERLTLNAQWVVEFLARRQKEGGDAYAQRFQSLALDYIKL